MSNGRNKLRKGDAGRDAGGFVALPWSVMDCPAFTQLSMHARGLLLEVARQFVRDNNGRLLLSRGFMAARGWNSTDMLTKAKKELLAAGFIFETVAGQRPNKAAWYAVTWRALDRHPKYDEGTYELFRRGAYHLKEPEKITLPRPPHGTGGTSLVPPHGTEKITSPVPPHGPIDRPIVPPHGTERGATVPPHGTIRGTFGTPPVPPHGHHLENHLSVSEATGLQGIDAVQVSAGSGGPVSDGKVTRTKSTSIKGHRAKQSRGRRADSDDAAASRPPSIPQPPDPTAQLELMLPVDGNASGR